MSTPRFDFLILNGPNLGHLGKRQPEIYGATGLDAVPGQVQTLMGDAAGDIQLDFFQANSEGALIDRLEQAYEARTDGVVFNAGAYTHTSLALADCLAWVKLPCVEVHISNIWARSEPLRHQSYIGRHAVGVIAGFGIMSYALAVQALYHHINNA
ncbi:type II 3-dehydroquinate dehydratase [Oceanidesulfovibrio marinus]|uniref:3-dehydroquinate dehydratase n=1 Tax=Oceanidesulfovibrio marinus TaxID=370038 RepID=A0A6P1ZI46_9BACT|nr:type II 3-dehydroquinate dehydratase [Oceanidesulfovibrio marinus]QJT08093.1 3-dehydroquinate dehydratase [Oceanidesulfovibrio marinus]TVM34994.1 3-dehydroquinate dehydratase [Oceanidesulfovibrio marinus]